MFLAIISSIYSVEDGSALCDLPPFCPIMEGWQEQKKNEWRKERMKERIIMFVLNPHKSNGRKKFNRNHGYNLGVALQCLIWSRVVLLQWKRERVVNSAGCIQLKHLSLVESIGASFRNCRPANNHSSECILIDASWKLPVQTQLSPGPTWF